MFSHPRVLIPRAAIHTIVATVALAGPASAQETASQLVLSPEAEQLIEQGVNGTFQDELTLSFRPYYFPSFQGGTLAMIGFEVGKAGLMYGVDPVAPPVTGAQVMTQPVEVAKLELFGALRQGAGDAQLIGSTFTVGRSSGGETIGVHSFGAVLQPGTYDLVWGVRDAFGGKAASRKDSLEVPDFTAAGLTTSTVVMATGNPAPATGQFQPNTVYPGVRVLTASFPDDLDRVFPRATPQVMLIYIVVGAQPSPTTAAFDLELEYRILSAEGESVWRAPVQPLDRPTVGQPIPIAEIESLVPDTEYRFEIVVRDRVGGTESTTEVPFRIAA